MKRLLVVALALAPLPLVTALVADGDARRLPVAVVEARDGDLFVRGRRITATRALDSQPDWSPDGRRIVFVRQEPGRRGSSLYVVRRDGGGVYRLTHDQQVVAMPAWSPNGRTIAYAASPLLGRQLRHLGRRGPRRAPVSPPRRAGRAGRAALEPDRTADRAPPRARRPAAEGEDPGHRHAAGRAARAPARLRPARSVAPQPCGNEARLRLGNRQRRRRPDPDRRLASHRRRADARAATRRALRRRHPRLPGRRPPPLHTRVDAHALAPARLPALRAPAGRRHASSSATARAASASPTTTGTPLDGSPPSAGRAISATARARSRTSSPSSRARHPATPTSTRRTSTARTSSYAAFPPASTSSSTARIRRNGSRSSTTRTTPLRYGSG